MKCEVTRYMGEKLYVPINLSHGSDLSHASGHGNTWIIRKHVSLDFVAEIWDFIISSEDRNSIGPNSSVSGPTQNKEEWDEE